MKKRMLIAIFIILLLIGSIVTYGQREKQVIKFFPFDNTYIFTYATTNLQATIEPAKQSYYVTWDVKSNSNKKTYLRQDLSLLFKNGKLLGVRSKWQQNRSKINFSETIPGGKENAKWEAISFHYGEIHQTKNVINSMQDLSQDTVYVVSNDHLFKNPKNKMEKRQKSLLDKNVGQQLQFHWEDLITYFKLNANDYHFVPLTELHLLRNGHLDGFSSEETQQIIGQLWEGLYKNYVIPAANSKQNQLDSMVPLILIDKNWEHLIVLYELNGKKEKLIQLFPHFD